MNKDNGFYDDTPEIETFAQYGGIDDYFRFKNIQCRKFFLDSDVDQIIVSEIVRHIMQINREDAGKDVSVRKPIFLYIASNGGSVDAGFQLIDAVESSVTPVYTVNIGCAYSMAFLIALAGHKRYATKNAKYLMHDGFDFVYGTSTKVQDQMEFKKKVEERIMDYVLSHSYLTREEYDSKLRVEWFMFADEAKEKGFVDEIIGVDAEIEAIV